MSPFSSFSSLDSPVLLLGETGVGKDFIANAILCAAFTEKQMNCSVQKSIAKYKFPANVTVQAFIKSWPDTWLIRNYC